MFHTWRKTMQEEINENAFSQSFVVVNSESTIEDALHQAAEADVTNLVINRKITKAGRTREFIINEYYVVSMRQRVQIFSSFGPYLPLQNIIDKFELAQKIEYDNQDIQEIRESLRDTWGVVLTQGRIVGLFGYRTDVSQTFSLSSIPNSVRFINAELEEHDETVPLQIGRSYTLAFNANIEMDAKLQEMSSSYGVVELDVQLFSDDFDINGNLQSLYILSNGKSKNKARFTIRPKFVGEGEISAIFLKSGNFIQLMNIKIQASASDSIGTPDPPIDPKGAQKVVATTPSLLENESRQPTGFSPSKPIIQTTLFGSSPNAIWTVKSRDLCLVIELVGASLFRIISTGVVVGSADLRITLNELQQYIEDARIALNDIVDYVDSK